MRGRGVFNTLILLGCAIVYTLGDKGKKVLLKIHVPELIKHHHHTNVVFVHKHHHHYDDHDGDHQNKHQHHHDDHEKQYHKHRDDGGKANAGHYAHSYGDHYSQNDGESPGYHQSYSYGDPAGYHHSHSYGHKQHYSFSHGNGDNHHGHGKEEPKKKTHSHVKKPAEVKHAGVGKKVPKYGSNNHQDKKNENQYDFAFNFTNPNTNAEHYHYASYTPTFSFDNDNNVRQSNHSIRHESLDIETTRNEFPDAGNFDDFPKTQTGSNYEVEEPSFGFQAEHHKANDNKKPSDGGSQGNFEFYGGNDERNKGLGSYAEDYTNPNSVAKYTSDIQHGTINLEDSNYNPEHGNDLEEYIRASGNSEDI